MANDTMKSNRMRTVQFLYRHRQATRTDIYQHIGLTPATVSQLVSQLIKEGLVQETGEEVSKTKGSGRKQKILTLNHQYAYFIGIDFTLAGLSAYLSDSLGNRIDSFVNPYSDIKKHAINDVVGKAINKMQQRYQQLNIVGAGLAIPGHYDNENHTLISNNKMWSGFNLAKIRQQISLPLVAENNIECMAMARFLFDAEKTPSKFLFLHSGYGLYCAFLQANNLHPKRNYYIGEIGHTVVDPTGFNCECGKRGCLQTYISETWLIKRAKKLYEMSTNTVLHALIKSEAEINLETILAAYQLGDQYITDMLVSGVDHLAISVANLLMMNDADAIYINSRLLQQPEFGQRMVQTIANQLQFIPTKKNAVVKILPYQATSGSRGACALVALTQIVKNKGYQQICLA